MNPPLPEPPWGVTIAVYLVLTGAASGVALCLPFAIPDDPGQRTAIELRAARLSLALFAATFAILLADLGRPMRFWMMAGAYNAASPMSAGVRLLVVEAFVTAVFWWLLRRRAGAIEGGDLTLAPGATTGLFAVLPRLLWVLGALLALYPAWLLSRVWMAPLSKGFTSYAAFMGSALSLGVAMLATRWPARRGRLAWIASAGSVLVISHAVALGLRGELRAALILAVCGALPWLARLRPGATLAVSLVSGVVVRAFLFLGSMT
ncbi:MAG: hypothetical protein EXQ77_06045 [Thermoleophilia bacterium]|nr:hypothetical protein [Thermoleophilia bacterium]